IARPERELRCARFARLYPCEWVLPGGTGLGKGSPLGTSGRPRGAKADLPLNEGQARPVGLKPRPRTRPMPGRVLAGLWAAQVVDRHMGDISLLFHVDEMLCEARSRPAGLAGTSLS
ncbi:MAG: hypothetical protein BJ554DRAFT_5317, partial [Olpidium bornovanus]